MKYYIVLCHNNHQTIDLLVVEDDLFDILFKSVFHKRNILSRKSDFENNFEDRTISDLVQLALKRIKISKVINSNP